MVGSQPLFRHDEIDSDEDGGTRRPSQPISINSDFHLRYDDEGMVSKLDIGGQDQAVRSVLPLVFSRYTTEKNISGWLNLLHRPSTTCLMAYR